MKNVTIRLMLLTEEDFKKCMQSYLFFRVCSVLLFQSSHGDLHKSRESAIETYTSTFASFRAQKNLSDCVGVSSHATSFYHFSNIDFIDFIKNGTISPRYLQKLKRVIFQ